MIRAWQTKRCVLPEQRVHAVQESGAHCSLLNSFVLVHGVSNINKDMWAGKVPLLLQRLMERERDCKELSLVQFMKFGPPSEEVNDAQRCACLQWVTAGSTEGGHDVEEKGGGSDAMPAGEWYGALSFQSNVSTAHLVPANVAVHWSTAKLVGSSYRSYINRSFRSLR